MSQLLIVLSGVGLAVLACVLQVVSVATSSWMNTNDINVLPETNGFIHAGLWKGCIDVQGDDICNDLNSVTDAMQAVRAMSILAFLLLGASAGVGALVAFRPNLQVQLTLLASGISFAGCIAAVVGIAIFMSTKWEMYTNLPVPQTLGIEFRFGFSVFLSIAAAVMALFSTLVYVLARSRIHYTQLGP